MVQRELEGDLALPRMEVDVLLSSVPEITGGKFTHSNTSSSSRQGTSSIPHVEGFEDEDMEVDEAEDGSGSDNDEDEEEKR